MLSINHVSYLDTQAFMDEVRLVVNNDYERVFSALTDWSELGQPDDNDRYDKFPVQERMGLGPWWSPIERRYEKKTKLNGRFISKRKEVK